ncbi:taste receptor type 2 member 43-like [Discoglossus pictus]
MVVSLQDQSGCLKSSPSNEIQFAMGLTNLFVQCIITVDAVGLWLSPLEELQTAMHFLIGFSSNLSFWLDAWICSFYCVTIVNFKNHIMTSLKMRLSSVVTKLLMVTVLGNVIISVPAIWNPPPSTKQMGTTNQTTHYLTYNSFITISGCVLPFILTITSFGFTLASLLGHVRRIKLNESTSIAPQLEAHYRACRTMKLLVICLMAFNLTEIIDWFDPHNNKLEKKVITSAMEGLYSTAQSIIVISGSSKLKAAFCRIGRCIKQ